MSTLVVVGFGLRVLATTPVEGWNVERKHQALLNPEVRRPLSASDSLWPNLDERLSDLLYDRYEVPGSRAPIGWLSLVELLEAARGMGIDRREGTVVAVASRVLHWKRLRRAVPSRVSPNWRELGWDVVAESGHGALCDFGFQAGPPTAEQRERWRLGLNEWHLFKDEADAMDFAAWRSRTMADHGPFFALKLFEISTSDCDGWERARSGQGTLQDDQDPTGQG
jgi:hypothetical protein